MEITRSNLDDRASSEEKSLLESLFPGGKLSIGKYELVSVVSSGERSIVYKAEDTHLRRKVALKIYSPTLLNDHRQKIFDEGRCLARIDSLHVSKCYNIEIINDNPVLVNQWIDGQTLDEFMGSNQLTYNQVKNLFLKIVRGVKEIHKQGLVHRDLKPSNIVVDNQGEPKIIDLGLAHELSNLKETACSGTYSYLAPEVANLNHTEIGPLTDIFGLGGILHFMLTGLPLYQASTKSELLDLARKCEITPTNQVTKTVSTRLDDVCTRCLNKIPLNRFQTAFDLEKVLGKTIPTKNILVTTSILVLGFVIYFLMLSMFKTRLPKPSVRLHFNEAVNGRVINCVGNQHGVLKGNVVIDHDGINGMARFRSDSGIEPGRVFLSNVVPPGEIKSRTVSIWFFDHSSKNRREILFEEGSSHRGMNAYLLNGDLHIGCWDKNWQSFQFTRADSNCWNHAVLVLDGDSNCLVGYLNGKKINTTKAFPIMNYEGHLSIGRQDLNGTRFKDCIRKNPPFGFSGLIDDFRIYETELSSDEVKRLYSLHSNAR